MLVYALQESSLLAKVGVAGLSAALALAVALFMRYKHRSDAEVSRLAAEAKSRADRITTMEQQLAVLNTQVAPMWAVALKKLAEDLHHPSERFADGDKLLEEFMSLSLTPERHRRFIAFLEERLVSEDPDISASEKESAHAMLIIARKVEAEATARLNGPAVAL